MEKNWERNQERLIDELTRARELTKLLLNDHNSSSMSHETRKYMIEKILSSCESALATVKLGASASEDSNRDCKDHYKKDVVEKRKTSPESTETLRVRSEKGIEGHRVGEPRATASMLDYSPGSLVGSSARSEGSDLDFTDQYNKNDFKKRKIGPVRTETMRVCSMTGLEGHPDYGYSWRKYGQKIIGGKSRRAYYKCTHRGVQGACEARKHVQRSVYDPSMLEITYQGRHTCIQASHLASSSASQEKDGPKQNKDPKLQTEDLDTGEQMLPSFSFPSPIGSEILEVFSQPTEVFSRPTTDNKPMDSFSLEFISPATFESNYFSVSPFQMKSSGMGHNFQTSESNCIVTNSQMGGFDFSRPQVDFDSNFPFDTPDFFP